MNAVERFGLARAGRGALGDRGARRMPLEFLLLAMAVAYALLAVATNAVLSAAVTGIAATLLTLRRMRAEVRELRCEALSD